ncbi:MAG: YIP1 family protein [bacterium]
MSWYFDNLYKIIVQPILFYQDMPKGSWREGSLSFALVTGWIMAFSLTLVFFINNYMPTGLSLIEGIKGQKLIIVIPVLAVMALAFFVMTLLIIGGILIGALLGLMFCCAAVLNFLLILLGGKGNIFEVLKASLYASSVLLAGLMNIFLMIPVKYKLMAFSDWINGERVIFYCASVYLYGLFSILGRKTHKVPKWKAFLAATVLLIALVLGNVVLSAKILPKLAAILG